ncbi:tetratricopeptide repeat protein [Nocardia sp. IBHARD005]|uniref:tetratricopeptide repeat protein n=1 Tax=Nocardia sp. IBHARD005 TaxID=3457765 RepID=UPI004059109D
MSGDENESADRLGSAALAAWRTGDVMRAGELASEAVRVDPDSLVGWQVSTRVAVAGSRRVEHDNQIRADKYAKTALRAARRCVELAPDDAENHRLLALALIRRDNKGAGAALDRAMRLDPNNADMYVARAELIRATEAPGTAAYTVADHMLHRALSLDPDNRGALTALGASEIRRGRTEEGTRRLLAAAGDDPAAQAAIPEAVRAIDPRLRNRRIAVAVAIFVAVAILKSVDTVLVDLIG